MGTAAIKACICSGGGGEKEEEEEAGGGTAGIDFNNPHLTGGETTKTNYVKRKGTAISASCLIHEVMEIWCIRA